MISFLSFGDSRLQNSLDRIRRQAEEFGVFDEINVLCEHDLPQDFKEKYADKLVLGSRGYGYWVWKPYLVLENLKRMQDGDVLLYCDCGSHINPNGHEVFNRYLDLARSSEPGILGFSLGHWFLEYQWTKSDLLDYFGALGNKDVILTPQIESNTIFIIKNNKSVEFVEKWYDAWKKDDDFNLINDSPSKIPNFTGFKEHRHDQSVFSILGKLNNIAVLEIYGNTFLDHGKNWDDLIAKGNPILARRDRAHRGSIIQST